MATTLTHRPSLAKTDARNFELSWQQAHKQTNTHTNPQTGTITIHCTANIQTHINSAIADVSMYLNDLCHISYWKYPRISISENKERFISSQTDRPSYNVISELFTPISSSSSSSFYLLHK